MLLVGLEIELYDPEGLTYGTATVTKLRLLKSTSTVPHQVCLEVEVDARWCDAHPRKD